MRICAIVKDEYPEYLHEWICHHLQFGEITLYNNGSPIGQCPHVEIISYKGDYAQIAAYHSFIKRYPDDVALFIDLDEFLFTDYTVKRLEAECQLHGALAFNWLMFGSSGLMNHTSDSQIKKFRSHLPKYHPVNKHIKTMVQCKNVSRFINPHSVVLKSGKYDREQTLGLSKDVDYSLGHIKHYFCRSEEEFKKKILIGRADTSTKRTMREFESINKECI